ncbi:hypothetical protein Y1Q_0004954 [Alligator mississippiensis]|uniref:Uncharacterized protein n=1 Tax=Alligator mississippiensis TaxID=8496 RepID=A0A151MYD0_ALLMI|nr:hypothetical protein Y1Q_0004954 [Alligator mississippiensis]
MPSLDPNGLPGSPAAFASVGVGRLQEERHGAWHRSCLWSRIWSLVEAASVASSLFRNPSLVSPPSPERLHG